MIQQVLRSSITVRMCRGFAVSARSLSWSGHLTPATPCTAPRASPIPAGQPMAPPTEINAHPHMSGGRIALVCNGIVENFGELRRQLRSNGVEFLSDTDTEVIVCLIYQHIEQGKDLLESVMATVDVLEGGLRHRGGQRRRTRPAGRGPARFAAGSRYWRRRVFYRLRYVSAGVGDPGLFHPREWRHCRYQGRSDIHYRQVGSAPVSREKNQQPVSRSD